MHYETMKTYNHESNQKTNVKDKHITKIDVRITKYVLSNTIIDYYNL